jgi:hypothetical protein
MSAKTCAIKSAKMSAIKSAKMSARNSARHFAKVPRVRALAELAELEGAIVAYRTLKNFTRP